MIGQKNSKLSFPSTFMIKRIVVIAELDSCANNPTARFEKRGYRITSLNLLESKKPSTELGLWEYFQGLLRGRKLTIKHKLRSWMLCDDKQVVKLSPNSAHKTPKHINDNRWWNGDYIAMNCRYGKIVFQLATLQIFKQTSLKVEILWPFWNSRIQYFHF